MISVMVVDDNRLSRELLRIILELEGCTVREFENGQDALDAALASPKDWELVFMDCSMPLLDGLKAAQGIVAKLPQSKIIGMSAAGDFRRADCLKAGMVDYLSKPFDRVKVRSILAAHLGSFPPQPSPSL